MLTNLLVLCHFDYTKCHWLLQEGEQRHSFDRKKGYQKYVSRGAIIIITFFFGPGLFSLFVALLFICALRLSFHSNILTGSAEERGLWEKRVLSRVEGYSNLFS